MRGYGVVLARPCTLASDWVKLVLQCCHSVAHGGNTSCKQNALMPLASKQHRTMCFALLISRGFLVNLLRPAVSERRRWSMEGATAGEVTRQKASNVGDSKMPMPKRLTMPAAS